ncbi:hypothetical protein GCK32_022061 [Trichostrongylus colubriformis]|uniref:Uncharacterized protein n=1 Tax=Trichostrongylus colubriformis TaxID=6319 RepID=A0AAN8FY35_TRICO
MSAVEFSEQSSRSSFGGLFADPRHGNQPTTPSGRWSPKQIADKFKDYDVDHRDDNNNGGENNSFFWGKE